MLWGEIGCGQKQSRGGEIRRITQDLCRGIMTCMRDGWECYFVPIVAGTKSMKEVAWNEAMEKFGVAKIR